MRCLGCALSPGVEQRDQLFPSAGVAGQNIDVVLKHKARCGFKRHESEAIDRVDRLHLASDLLITTRQKIISGVLRAFHSGDEEFAALGAIAMDQSFGRGLPGTVATFKI